MTAQTPASRTQARRACPVGMTDGNETVAWRLEEAGDVFAHLVFPVGPVVTALRAPVV